MTMMNGTVGQISTKPVNTKFGQKNTYSANINGNWVKFGFKDPCVNVGDVVEFDAESGAYGLEAKNGIRILSKAGTATATFLPPSTAMVPAAAPAAAPVQLSRPAPAYAGKVFPIPALHGDRSIIRQNALARGTELFIGCRGGKPFDLDTDEATKIIIGIARQFEAYTAGDIDAAEASAEFAVDVPM